MDGTRAEELAAYYARGEEAGRLAEPEGLVEFLRTLDVLARVLPPAPATVADIGGGPGRYALHLADAGYDVVHRDLMPHHVEHLASSAHPLITTDVGDARSLDLDDGSVDAVLLLGPLYHLDARSDRVQALREARRIARPGAPVVAAVISRWAPRLDGILTKRLYETSPSFLQAIDDVEATGTLPAIVDAGFAAYCHRPEELREECEEAGLRVEGVVGVEGMSFALPDLAERLADPRHRAVLLAGLAAHESVPELLGVSPHLLAVTRRPA